MKKRSVWVKYAAAGEHDCAHLFQKKSIHVHLDHIFSCWNQDYVYAPFMPPAFPVSTHRVTLSTMFLLLDFITLSLGHSNGEFKFSVNFFAGRCRLNGRHCHLLYCHPWLQSSRKTSTRLSWQVPLSWLTTPDLKNCTISNLAVLWPRQSFDRSRVPCSDANRSCWKIYPSSSSHASPPSSMIIELFSDYEFHQYRNSIHHLLPTLRDPVRRRLFLPHFLP